MERQLKKGGDFLLKFCDFRKQSVNLWPEKVSVLKKIGVYFGLKICEKGSFLKMENTDGYTFYIKVEVPGMTGLILRAYFCIK